MLEPTDAITNEVLEPITFVLAYPTVFYNHVYGYSCITLFCTFSDNIRPDDSWFKQPKHAAALDAI